MQFSKDLQYYKFCLYGFLKNLRFFEPFLLLFFLEKGLSFLQIGTLYALREIITNVLEIPSGFIADALGRRRVMLLSFVFYIGSFLLFYYANAYAALGIAMLFYAAGDAFRTGIHKSMIFTYLQLNNWVDQKVYYYGHTRSWSLMGTALSALIAAVIVFSFEEYYSVFLFSIVPYIINMALIASYPNDLEGVQRRQSYQQVRQQFQQLFSSFIQTFKNADTLKVVNNVSVYGGFYKSMKDYLQPILQALAISLPFLIHLEEEQRSALLIGQVYFFIFLLNAIASRNAGHIAAFFKQLHIPLNGSLILGLTLGGIAGCFYYFDWKVFAVLLYLVIFVLHNIRKPIGVAYLSDQIDDKIMATGFSVQNQVRTLWSAVIAILLGTLADTMGIGPALAFTCSALLLLVPLFWLQKGIEKQKI